MVGNLALSRSMSRRVSLLADGGDASGGSPFAVMAGSERAVGSLTQRSRRNTDQDLSVVPPLPCQGPVTGSGATRGLSMSRRTTADSFDGLESVFSGAVQTSRRATGEPLAAGSNFTLPSGVTRRVGSRRATEQDGILDPLPSGVMRRVGSRRSTEQDGLDDFAVMSPVKRQPSFLDRCEWV